MNNILNIENIIKINEKEEKKCSILPHDINYIIKEEENIIKLYVTNVKENITVNENVTKLTIKEDNIKLNIYENLTVHPINNISSDVIYKSGEYLSGHRAIKIENNKAYYASNEIFSDKYKVIGISKGASIINEDCIITTYGEMSEPSWNWIEGLPIYLSSNGLLTQTVPVSNYILQIATVISSTKIFINIKIPLIIGGS